VAEPLNVLFILADQFRADCLGAAGNPVIQTPNLDALAAEGALFRQCYVQTAPCGPSRMCIFTSRYLCSTRALDNQTPLVDAQENVAMALRDAGHRPALMGYNDYAVDPRILPPDDPRTYTLDYDNFLPGFEVALDHEYDSREYFQMLREKGYPEWLLNHKAVHTPNVPSEGPGAHLPLRYPAHYRTEDCECRFITNVAIDHIRQRRDSGWVLSLNYIKPHSPKICSAPFNDMYDPADMPPANRRHEELSSSHPYLAAIHRRPQLASERDLRETRANYYGMITELDTSLGILFDALKASGQWERTLILFSSDHGDYLGDHYLDGKERHYEAAIHVPLIIRDPAPDADATRGCQLDGFVESIDLAPTLMAYLGLPAPDRFQGKSLLGQLRGDPAARAKTEVYYEWDFRKAFRQDPHRDPDRCLLWSVRDRDHKYVQFADEQMPALLYDLREDPEEQHNVAEDPARAGTVMACCQKLLRWRMANEDQRMEHWASKYRR
jgi:arylsulfatase A-like enzyme